MKHNKQTIERLKIQRDLLVLILLIVITCLVGSYVDRRRIISPIGDNPIIKVVEAEERLSDYQKIDRWVDIYCSNYFKGNQYSINRCKALTHFLLLREQNYGGSTNCGDSGLACGPLQFHAGTYTKNRKDMIKKGLVKSIGSRENMENAIETAVYMFSIGQEKQWGPILREEIKL